MSSLPEQPRSMPNLRSVVRPMPAARRRRYYGTGGLTAVEGLRRIESNRAATDAPPAHVHDEVCRRSAHGVEDIRSMVASTALELLARVGFVVKGALYTIVGVLALQVATSAGGRVTGTSGALLSVVRQPFGRTLLLGAAAGLLGYAAWRILQGLLDSDRL